MIESRIARWIFRIVGVNICIALTIPLFKWAFGSVLTWPWFSRQYLISLIYTNVIGLLLNAVIPPLWSLSKRWSPPVRWGSRLVLLVGSTWIGCLIGAAITVLIFRDWSFWNEVAYAFRIALPLSFIVLTISVLFDTYKDRLEAAAVQLKVKELERQRALTLATQTKLSSLESRIHPHFLFNALNSVASLIHDDPNRAELLLNQLARLLRSSLDSGNASLVPLEQEMKIVRAYLDIEKARFAGRLRYDVAVPAALMATMVPPLSIQSLVENSIKYAVAPSREGGSIWVTASRDLQSASIFVIDDGPGFGEQDLHAGHGLDNLQERLAALFGDEAKLGISRADGKTTVNIQVPLTGMVSQDSQLGPAEAALPRSRREDG